MRGAEHIADAVARAHRHARRQRLPSKARCRSGNPSAHRDRCGSAFTRGKPASASKVPSAPVRRHRDAPRASTGPRRNDRRRGCRSRGTAIPACAGSIAGSRITARGIASGWRTLSLTLVAVLVTPALAENSPPAIVVGHADLAHRRCRHRRRRALHGANAVHVVDVANVVGEAKLHGFGAVGDRAAADRDDKVGIGVARHARRPRSPLRAACAPASHRKLRRNGCRARG